MYKNIKKKLILNYLFHCQELNHELNNYQLNNQLNLY